MSTNLYRCIFRNGLKMMESFIQGETDKAVITSCTLPDDTGWTCSKISKQKWNGTDLDKAIDHFNGTVIYRQDN